MRLALAVAAALVPLLALTACGSGTAGHALAGAAASPQGIDPARDVVSGEQKVDAIAALLPADVRKAGTLRVGSSVGTPPSAYYPDPATRKPAGLDIDVTDAVARVLGLTVDRQEAAFETILPALSSGKYDFGTGNFGVTTARLKTIDFVTYIDDGQGFAVRRDNTALTGVSTLQQLCGLTVGTGAGTTFETTLNTQKHVCADAGKKPYTVQSFSDSAALLTSLQQGRIDTVMSTINGLRYQAAQPAAGTRFVGEFHRLDVGFAFAKGTPLAPAFQAAVNQLIKDGTYQRILQKWGTADSAIPQSQIDPPEHA
ncbi:polar amino acid transport system substrate-binding protein [Kitasatospora sp. MAA4]|uniref:ABC transporter substrate-binding protein n=1 Tax=Kitasatospora sp. MAA4 TaxID=3035093 RepID=UPI0024767968|nr:ABC transporter substrate-binding protein [Kitasatospora sp. MAA4]MDH6133047.1 polar amino acid transport system substrate-binding protein [Kitasatospora sp. MAA4]